MGDLKPDKIINQPYTNIYRKQALDHHRQRFLRESKLALPRWLRTAFIIALLCTVGVASYLFYIIRAFGLLK
jgi:hypothetical protein